MLRTIPRVETDTPAGRLMVQFLGWIATRPRRYDETMEAWRTSCPRLSVWEDAVAGELVQVDATSAGPQGARRIRLTEAGQAALRDSMGA